MANLNIWTNYSSTDQIHTVIRLGLQISYISSSILHSPTNSFKLRNVYHVPSVKNNLLSVSHFTKYNDVVFEFYPTFYYVKD